MEPIDGLSNPDLHDLEQEIRERTRTRTHWDKCWIHPHHRDCAIYRLLGQVWELKGEVSVLKIQTEDTHESWKEMWEKKAQALHDKYQRRVSRTCTIATLIWFLILFATYVGVRP